MSFDKSWTTTTGKRYPSILFNYDHTDWKNDDAFDRLLEMTTLVRREERFGTRPRNNLDLEALINSYRELLSELISSSQQPEDAAFANAISRQSGYIPQYCRKQLIENQRAIDFLHNIGKAQFPSRTTHEVLGTLEGKPAIGTPDTGAAVNTINTSFAKRLGFRISRNPEHRVTVKTLHNKSVVSDGLVRLWWTFASEPQQRYEVVFHAISNSPHDIMFGMPFLHDTGMLRGNNHRITTRRSFSWPLASLRKICLQSMEGYELPQFEGTLNGETVLALADSGSEVNVMSMVYTKAHGLDLCRESDQREVFQFADGSQRQSAGRVSASWKLSGRSDPLLLDFQVLEDSQFDIVLGQDVVFSTNVFQDDTEHGFLAPNPLESPSYAPVNAVRSIPWFMGLKRLMRLIQREHTDGVKEAETKERNAELERHARAEELIQEMPEGLVKTAAREAARRQCQAWLEFQRQRQQTGSAKTSLHSSQSSSSNPSVRPETNPLCAGPRSLAQSALSTPQMTNTASPT